ncbi:putative nucleoporin [Podospora australis]|uniref:Nucleoporin n=1 Tax=Podospora australis TaxID=1536484 RepID=A0AAN6X3W0_9PEZI|nr:putative nucleoporin [Podospora australis]
MAFSFGNAGNGMIGASAGGAGGLTQGNNLEVIQTEGLGFLSISGEAKVQLTPKWSPPPAPTASLISIASRKGLVAAAGPEAVYIATTESVRKAFEGEKNGDSEVRPFNPQATVPLPFRISQLSFTADEQYLILSAESGGGLAVYETQALTSGSTQSAFEISTNGETLRALAPNPMPELGNLCAIVTNNGNLLMANLAERKLVSGANGPVLRAQVSCVSWSTKGKQLVAGMADGSIYQMTPEGVEKAHIPKPPSLGDYHVAALAWIENHVFLAIHNQTNGQDPSVYHVITRQQPPGGTPTFTYQKLTDPVEPFVADKVPHHSILRLKEFPPNLQDLLLVSSTATEGVGLISRSKTPLTQDKPAASITNVFTTTELADDSRRAQLPMSEDLTDTYPIGSALDLSSKDKVYKPIPTDEIDESPGPLPGFWVLNNEGVLSSWWVVYNESIRSGTTYPGITGDAPASTFQASTASVTPASGTTAFGSPAPSGGAFGAPTTGASAFGTPPAFGGSSVLGSKPSPWSSSSGAAAAPAFGSSAFGSKPAATAPAFGAPAFGQPAAPTAFGQSSALGMGMSKPSPWATGSTGTAAPAFGQTGLGSSATSGKVFGSGGGTPSGASGFASFASKPGFGTMAGNTSGSSIFGSKPASTETSTTTSTAFPPPAAKTDKPAFGSSPFVLGTTFKADPASAADNEKPKESTGASMFGGGFGLSLENASKQPPVPESKDEDMDAVTPAPGEKPKPPFSLESTTPTTTPAPPKFEQKTLGPVGGGNIFGAKPSGSESSNVFGAPKPPTSNIFGTPKPGDSIFGASKPAATSIFGTPNPTNNVFGAPKPSTNIFGTPKLKLEDENKENVSSVTNTPLPPDSTISKPPVKSQEAPLPPDFLSKPVSKETSKSPGMSEPEAAPVPADLFSNKPKPAIYDAKPSTPEEAPLPPDFLGKPATNGPAAVPAIPDSPQESELSEGEVEDETQELDQEEGEEEDEEEGAESEEEEGTEAGSEGSGIDVTREFSPTAGAYGSNTPGFTPHGSFDGMTGSAFSTISRSEANPTRPFLGELNKNAPALYPKMVPPSPRSPSPMRGPPRSSLLRPGPPDTPRAPGLAAELLGRRSAPPQSSSPYATRLQPQGVDPNVLAQRKLAAKQKEADERIVIDPEDEGTQQILNAPLEPTLEMHEFLAADTRMDIPVANNGDEVPGACESLWRDINRMIDRLGLNSRSLQSFYLGHTSPHHDGPRTKHDLENPDEWVLVEAEDLGRILDNDLPRELEEGRIKDVDRVEDAIQGLNKDLIKLRAKEEDMRKIINLAIDPEQQSVAKSLPLSAEQAAQQNELRRSYATFTKLLAETEEALTMLKTKITAAGGASGRAPVPTVDAIIRTINKMTTMAEKRSGDIDVLENQMRRLRLGSVGPNGTLGPRSREGSPFVTPQRRSMMSPERMRDSPFASSISYGMRGTPPRKKLSAYTDEEKRAVRQKQAERKNVLQLLKASLQKAGPNVSRLRDDE